MGGSSTVAGRSFKGKMQGFAYWPGTAISDANMLSLYNTWATSPTPTTPDAPSITAPEESDVLSNSLLVTVTDGADTGEYGTLEYMVEYNLNSGGWTTLIDWQETRPVLDATDIHTWDEGTLELRAYMRRSAGTVSATLAPRSR